MAFSETVKSEVRKRADHRCCWCKERINSIEIHHIEPQNEGGPDTMDNAAPLCPNCHTILGNNPDHRKQIRERRDHLYEEIAIRRQISLYPGDLPMLDFFYDADPESGLSTKGIVFTNRDKGNIHQPPDFYLTVYFKKTRYFAEGLDDNEKWLYLEATMFHMFSLRVQVRAYNDRDVIALINFLKTGYTDRSRDGQLMGSQGWNMQGWRPNESQSPDYFYVGTDNDKTRLVLSTFSPTHAPTSARALFSDRAKLAFAEYLENTDFVKGIDRFSID